MPTMGVGEPRVVPGTQSPGGWLWHFPGGRRNGFHYFSVKRLPASELRVLGQGGSCSWRGGRGSPGAVARTPTRPPESRDAWVCPRLLQTAHRFASQSCSLLRLCLACLLELGVPLTVESRHAKVPPLLPALLCSEPSCLESEHV